MPCTKNTEINQFAHILGTHSNCLSQHSLTSHICNNNLSLHIYIQTISPFSTVLARINSIACSHIPSNKQLLLLILSHFHLMQIYSEAINGFWNKSNCSIIEARKLSNTFELGNNIVRSGYLDLSATQTVSIAVTRRLFESQVTHRGTLKLVYK